MDCPGKGRTETAAAVTTNTILIMTKSEIICHIGKHYWQDSYITHDEMLNMRKKDLEKYLEELKTE